MDNVLHDPGIGGRSAPVLFVLNHLGIGGSERKTIAVVNELVRGGRSVHLAYLTDRTTSLERVDKKVPLIYLERKGRVSLTAFRMLREYLQKHKFSKIFCVNLYPLLYVTAATWRVKSAERPAVVLMVNVTEQIGRKANLSMLLYRPLMRRAERIVFGCQAQLELWCSRYSLDSSRCSVIYNGVDSSKFVQTVNANPGDMAPPVEPREFVLGAVGQLRPEKNHGELIAAFEQLKDKLSNARLVIIGQGPERARLEAVVSKTGLHDRISMPGQMGDVRPVLKTMSVFVLPSISETFSNAVLEAMAMGIPVILSDTGGAREMVRHGVNGYLYEQGNIAVLTALIEKLAADPALRRAIGQQARATVMERFTFSEMVLEYQRLLDG